MIATIKRVEPNGFGRVTVTLEVDLSWKEAGNMQVGSDGTIHIEEIK